MKKNILPRGLLISIIILVNTILLSISNTQLADSLQTTTDVKTDSIFYSAKNGYYNAIDTLLILSQKAVITYHLSSISADSIIINFTDKQAYTVGKSILKDNNQILEGEDIKFDMDKKSGIINNGVSEFDKGFYYGKEIRKIGDDVYDVDNGVFTTCNAKEPHFRIVGSKVRLYLKDKVIMEPVVFYVNHFPVLAMPFGTFTLKKGRKTGILVPSPGYNKTDGKYIRNIAFYYAYKDYANILLSSELYEKTGWGVHLNASYIKRYVFNGKTDLYVKKNVLTPLQSTMLWHLKANHNHDFGNGKKFRINIDFLNNKNILEGIDNVTDRLSQQITSSASYDMPLGDRTLRFYSNYNHNMLNDVRTVTLPQITYSLPTKPFYELFIKDDAIDKWYSNFSYSYSFKAIHSGKIIGKNPSMAQIFYKVKNDSTGAYLSQHNAGILNQTGIRFEKKLWSWLNFSSSVSDKFAVFDRDKNDKILQVGNSYSISSGLKFSLYGVRNMPNFFLSGIRHIATPSLSFSYNPDFSKNDRFYKSPVSISSSPKSERFTFSLANKWQLKLKLKKDAEPKKLNDFLSITSSLSYDKLAVDGKGFSNISHKIKLRTGSFKTKFFTLKFLPNMSVYQNPYNIKLKSIDPSLWKAGIYNWTFDTTFSLDVSSEASYKDYFPIELNRIVQNSSSNSDSTNIENAESKKKWSANLSFDYNTDKERFKKHNYTGSLRGDMKFYLTKNWRISYNNYYNIKDKKLISYSISIERELHCWKFVFKYTKQSTYWSYNFRIFNIKLPDVLKFKTSDNRRL